MFNFNKQFKKEDMHGLDNLRTRLNYRGGVDAEGRFLRDKEKTLKKALWYSYQAETAILQDGREFRCLINTDKTKPDYDTKIISIPYEDLCLTSNKVEKIDIKCGDVFKWKETNTYWLVYLEKLEENAYFRAEIYKCEEEILLDNRKYHIYIRGPVETTIQWNQQRRFTWNDLNYSLIIYITKDDFTLDYFRRFKEIKIGGKTWRVDAVDPYSADGIIEVSLGETFNNDLNDYYEDKQKIQMQENQLPPNKDDIYIEGPKIVSPYERYKYIVHGLHLGNWEISNYKKASIKEKTDDSITIDIITGKSGDFILRYTEDEKEAVLPIIIKSI